ncbi:MAG: hypothetical protein KC413_20645 [Anaerolineales bacterium]|nr:hypothetical protein [Anaerolineales bacterium]
MSSWLPILIIISANLSLGWLMVRLFAATFDWVEGVLLRFALGTAVLGTLALILAQLGWFSIARLGLLWLLLLIILIFLNIRTRRNDQPIPSAQPTIGKPQLLLLIIYLPIALWLFGRPHEFIIGGADAGVYTNLSAEIAQHGGILIDDPLLAQLDPTLYPALLRPTPDYDGAVYYLVPAFFVTEVGNGRLTPQFYPLHPVWQAVAYALGGATTSAVRAALLLTGLWALAGSLAVYLTARQVAGWPAAMLALVGLSLNALQIWFARYPTTEMMSQFWLWTGIWAVGAWLSGRRPAQLWALLGGVALGQFFLVRIDALFILPILGLLVLWLWLRQQTGRGWFTLPLVTLILYSLAHGWWFSRPYFLELFGYGLAIARQQQLLLVGAVIVGVAVLVTAVILWRRFGDRFMVLLAQWQRPILGVLAVVLLLLAVYAWFIRPTLPPPPGWQDSYSTNLIPYTNHENLVRLGWYLSPLGIALGALGVAWMVWRMEGKTAVLLAIALLYSLLYLWNIRANPHQIYAARRYVMATLPLFVLGTAVFLNQLWGEHKMRPFNWRRGLALLLALAWLGSSAWAARGFVSQVDYRGVIDQLDSLNDQLDAESVLLFADPSPVGNGDFWGTPLKFMYDHSVFTLRDPAAVDAPLLVQTMENWQNNGRTVYWIGDTDWLTAQNLAFQPVVDTTLTADNLEGVYDHKPQAILTAQWHLPIVKIGE